MKRWIQVALLALALAMSMGTSKRLLGKKLLKPTVKLPAGVILEGQPRALLKENPGNQGCFASQRIDFRLRARIRNDSKKPLQVHRDWVQLTLGFDKKQTKYRVTKAFFEVRDAQGKAARGAALAPGAQGVLQVSAQSIFSKKLAPGVRWLRLEVDLQGGRLQLEYRNIQNIKTENVR